MISESVGVSAFRFSMLDTSIDKVVDFDYEEALSFKGETGSYLQYAFTRISGILRKVGEWNQEFENQDLTDQEKKLVKLMSDFPKIVQECAEDLKPYLVCKYTHRLATALDRFYEACPVLKAKTEELRNFRITLMQATRTVLRNAFNLIGIEALDIM
jgi:arginyl-tRNA synthetase